MNISEEFQTDNLEETYISKIESTTQFPSLANVHMCICMIYWLSFYSYFMDLHGFHRTIGIIKLLHSRENISPNDSQPFAITIEILLFMEAIIPRIRGHCTEKCIDKFGKFIW